MSNETIATKTVCVDGQRLQVTCRALGLDYSTYGEWVPNSNRHYPDRWRVTGVKLTEADAHTLKAHFATIAAKAELKRYRAWLESHQPKEQVEAARARKLATQQKRVQRERDTIAAVVTARWTLSAEDLESFIDHANEPGAGRVLRTKSACTEPFEVKVYMALVAWARHNKTDYESELRAANDDAWDEARSLKPDFDAGERWSDLAEEDRWAYDDARDHARAQCAHNHAQIQRAKTEEAKAWLAHYETELGALERQLREGAQPVMLAAA